MAIWDSQTRTFKHELLIFTVFAAGLVGIYGCIGCGGMKSAAPPPLPEFPWPPPEYSGREVVPNDLVTNAEGATNLFDVDRRLRIALDGNGYFESSYYAVPGGFALVTQIERFDDDGNSFAEPARWTFKTKPLGRFSFREYLRALFMAEPGRYRLIVFVVTGVPFASSGEQATSDEAREWLSSGGNILPPAIGNLDFGEDYACTALIYEFARESEDDEVLFLDPGYLPARRHLVSAGIWVGLEGE